MRQEVETIVLCGALAIITMILIAQFDTRVRERCLNAGQPAVVCDAIVSL